MTHGIVIFEDDAVGVFSTLGTSGDSVLVTFQGDKYKNLFDLAGDGGIFLTLLEDPPILESEQDHDASDTGTDPG